TFRAMGERAIAIRNYDSAIGSLQRAMQTYDAIERRQSAGDRLLPVLTQTQLNHLSLALDIRDWSSTVSDRTKQAEWATLAADLPVESLTRSASEALPQLSLNRNTLYARLNFIHSLLRQSSSQPLATVHQIEADASSWEEAIARLLVSVYQDTQQLKDAKVESLALGRLGALYEKQNQLEAAWSTTTQALSISQALYADELSYQWQWQLGRLLNAQDRYDESLEAFQQAVQLLESIRSNLRFIDTDVQFSFRDSVEPVYREYLELLLRTDNAVSPSADNLRQAVFSVNDLQLTELENFLSCSLGNDTSGVSIVGSRQGERTEQNLFQLDPNAAIFHPILLADRLVTILELPTDDGIIISKEIDVPQDEIESVLKRLRTNLGASPDRIPNVKADAQIVYRWLIEPFAEQLDQAQINTLVFVLDGPLRNIPMGVLFDGETYLLDRYSIAIAPQIELLAPQPLQDSLRIFTGGIGEEQNIGDREFEKIENLIAELDGIREISDAASPLVGADFTKEKLEERLTAERFSAIHIKTHGVFSSDPEETFIVASNELIKSHDLGNLIRLSTRNNETPIELLVLSACSTAEG
ncbi:MAG: CHAT domain-containing protein, partial [Cyanobacteria bacterium J06633_2]